MPASHAGGHLAVLVAKPDPRPATTSTMSTTATQHTELEWAAVYPHILRLYVHERRKLRYVVTFMEQKYNFLATTQMYKKRFTKWGFFKNSRRPHGAPPSSQSSSSSPLHYNRFPPTAKSPRSDGLVRRSTESPLTITVPPSPKLSRSDTTFLLFFTNIRTWCTAYFDAVDISCRQTPPAGNDHSPYLVLPYTKSKVKTCDAALLSSSFKLVADLLRRGQGVLAGRLARKAFLQVEQMLLFEGPIFIWNLLEILHSIMHFRQARLYEMLVAQLIGLSRSHYPDEHAIVQMLSGLWELSRSFSGREQPQQFLSTILEQGWLFNADLVLSVFDYRLLLLYSRLMWDSALIRLARDKLRDVDLWFSLVENNVPAQAICEGTAIIHPDAELTVADARRRPPADYEDLKARSLADIREKSRWPSPAESDTRFRVLSALRKSRIIDDDTMGGKVSRLHARVLAYVIRILAEIGLDERHKKDEILNQMSFAIELREYGEGVAAPPIIYDMWQLRDLLAQEGRSREAAEMGREANKRLEQYLEDIPIMSVKDVDL